MAFNVTLNLPLTLLDNGMIDDGALLLASGHHNEVKRLNNETLVGLQPFSADIINKYNLNGHHELTIRQNHKALRSLAKQHTDPLASPIEYFSQSLIQITTLNRNSDTGYHTTGNLFRTMLYGNVITALESLLSDYLIEAVQYHDACFDNLKNKHELFKDKTRDVSIEILRWVVFHNLSKAGKLYSAALQITLLNPEYLEIAISNRHDIVHRNGYKKGNPHPEKYFKEQIFDLVINIQKYVINILLDAKSNNKNL